MDEDKNNINTRSLDDLSNLRKPSMVIFRGKIIKNPKVKKFKYVEEELDKHLYD